MPVKTTLKENISIALQSIAGNRLRTSLTSLIIAIGIMALVGILTAIEGIKQYTTDAFSSLGANSFTIQNRGSGVNFGNGGHRKIYPSIRYDQAQHFREAFKLPALIAINLDISGIAIAKYGSEKTNPNITVTGTNENYLQTNGYKLAFGRNFSETELEHGANVVIIGNELKNKLFKNEDPINKSIFVGSNKFRVIGVFAPKGSSAGMGGDRLCTIPILKAKQIAAISNPSFAITIMVNTAGGFDASIGEATSLFRNIRGLTVANKDNFEITRSDSVQQQLAGQLSGMTIAGFAIGIITLIGAAIGLMNIMLVSVTERTREIGIRKAIGATPAVIRKQFLIEAIVICLIGGIGGIILGMAVGNLIAIQISGKFIVPWLWLFAAIGLCTLIGLLSGSYPAKKASKLDPVEALRYE
ncbi:ABC transporter permease [Mucilaginibacter sp.]|uniref:ABC transporter permease n=1 Tax=Mucilaginibacter sp. TaxID=1882438 RepID=UPI002639AAF9|nr:ABC transporter permease [Mucilaginibacter sp.]MDB4927382.1 transporter [Mucilaginibacter sp.]